MQPHEEVLIKTLEYGVLTLTMNRPHRLNALNRELGFALLKAVREAETQPEVKVIVIAGAGKGFCAGGDVEDMSNKADHEESFDDHVRTLRDGMELSRILHESPKLTIARLHGAVAGAGMSVALACDLRIAGKSTKLTTAFARVGLSGDFGGTYYLTHLVGVAKAKELYFSSPTVVADEGLRLGIYTQVVEDDELIPATDAVARRLADGPSLALQYIKANINFVESGASHAAALDHEAVNHIKCALTRDHLEAATAFVEKRKPVFEGR